MNPIGTSDPRYGCDVKDWHSWQEGRKFGRSEAMSGLPRFVIWLWWRLAR